MDKPKIIVITGPTATGKTALGVELARMVDGEVVSADSMQIYKHMDIGTAKPTKAERFGIPHHMLDIIPPWEDYSTARYVSDAAQCIEELIRRKKTPILVGGTGLYIDSLLSGRTFSARGDTSLRRELEDEYDDTGAAAMLQKLRQFDPESAAKLHANDKKRIVRAIEVFLTTGKPISEHDRETRSLPSRYDAIKLALSFSDRAVLYSRIDRRVDNMLLMGLEREVRSLLEMGVPSSCTAMQAIGYKEITNAILGESTMDDAVESIKMESRRYAKRQLTWLRRDAVLTWHMWENTPDIVGCAEKLSERLRASV